MVERRPSWEESEAAATFCEEMDSHFYGTGTFDITKYDFELFSCLTKSDVIENEY